MVILLIYAGLRFLRDKQWGIDGMVDNTYCYVTLPITATPYVVLATDDIGGSSNKLSTDYVISWQDEYYSKEKIRFVSRLALGAFCWIAICHQ